MHKIICNCILSDNEESLLNFSQSCNRDKKENPHCIIILHVKMFWIESCLGNVLFDTILCVTMQGILYLRLKHLFRGCLNQLEISFANKWRSIDYDGKMFWGVGLAKTQQDQIVATHPRTTRITITFGALPQSQQEVHALSCLNTDFWLSQ